MNSEFVDMQPVKYAVVANTPVPRYCMDRVSSCNIYAVQQDTQSVVMSEFIHHLC